MRTLIVGGGIAGLTLAGLMARQGQSPVVIDRRPEGAGVGYALALWPHGSRVFHALGIHEEFVAASQPMRTYAAEGPPASFSPGRRSPAASPATATSASSPALTFSACCGEPSTGSRCVTVSASSV